MSWHDPLKASVGSILNQAEMAALPAIMNNVLGAEGVQTILTKLQEGGMGQHVSSWLDQTQQNLPLSSEQLRKVSGNEHVQQLAASLGLPVDKMLAVLAEHLPRAASAEATGPDK
jgi:uncharacterized protein YidB (DUF937 family)